MMLTADGRGRRALAACLLACARHQTGGITASELQPAGSNTETAANSEDYYCWSKSHYHHPSSHDNVGMCSGLHAFGRLGTTRRARLDDRIAVLEVPVSPALGLMPDGSLQSVQVQFARHFSVRV